MTTFAYTALDPAGKKRTGFVDALNKDAAVAAITADGRFVVQIAEHAAQKGSSTTKKGETPKRGGKASRSDLALFSRRLADLALAGLPARQGAAGCCRAVGEPAACRRVRVGAS